MKYPKQKDPFSCEIAKTNFQDARTHCGRVYTTHQEAALATGLFKRRDEATKVLEEMVQLQFTGAQVPNAFLKVTAGNM